MWAGFFFVLFGRGCMNHIFPASYAWGNFSVFAVGIWAIVQRDSLDAIMMFLTGLLLTVLTDIIHISIFYPPNNYLTDAKRFSIGMAIFSLLLKPLSCYLVYRMYRERGGEYKGAVAGCSESQSALPSMPSASSCWGSCQGLFAVWEFTLAKSAAWCNYLFASLRRLFRKRGGITA
uniref:Uncharacterized protein n=1 Tax=Melopsittacus undulatus TaxID=13146 RepID=A0A8V5HEC5_MELUD